MPQMWLTYAELGQELACTPDRARSIAIAAGWTRKHSHDGLSRVLLPPLMMQSVCRTMALRASIGVTDTAGSSNLPLARAG